MNERTDAERLKTIKGYSRVDWETEMDANGLDGDIAFLIGLASHAMDDAAQRARQSK